MQNQSVIHAYPEIIMGGTPVFVGTRVPVQTLFEYLAAGDSIEEFMEDFPSVTKDQIKHLIDFQAVKGNRRYGLAKGQFTVPDDFDAPLPDEILESFEGTSTDFPPSPSPR